MIGARQWLAIGYLLLCATNPLQAAVAADRVKIGTVASTGEFILNVAQGKGYFAQEGIEPDYTFFDSAAKAIAPLGTGQIDVAGGAVSVGLFNAIERDIDIRIIADRTSVAPAPRALRGRCWPPPRGGRAARAVQPRRAD